MLRDSVATNAGHYTQEDVIVPAITMERRAAET